MTPPKRILFSLALLALVSLTCSLPLGLGAPILENPDVVPTMVAQTMEALRAESQPSTPTASTTPFPRPTLTSTPEPVSLSLKSAASCYAGPGRSYGFIASLAQGTAVTVVGRDPMDDFWIIEVPGQSTAVCWLSGQNALPSGDTSALPLYPTPVPSIYTLSEPKNLRVSCSVSATGSSNGSDWVVVFRWTNTEPDQYGVRVYRSGRYLKSLGPRASSYTDVFFHRDNRGGVTYGVQAYGDGVVSSIVTIDLNHCG